ncbi:alkaline phosphatase [Ignavigranum ruoffiae]|uniref:alkaline phosphatase n=1 Tax=Ignavigranum ruoffiae TaxID=89093 RepID=UPI0024AD290A|nr:alkaline phosphatase [Ignavigranum ruoffiae]
MKKILVKKIMSLSAISLMGLSTLASSVSQIAAEDTTSEVAESQAEETSGEETSQAASEESSQASSESLPIIKLPEDRPLKEDYSLVNENQAKYVFLFIGDGMGVMPVSAAEQYQGLMDNQDIKPTNMNFTDFPVIGLQSPYDCHSFIPDSASTATAFGAGNKTVSNTIGLNKDFTEASESSAEKAKKHGKSVGIISTVTLNHATPAAFYANVESRKSYYEIGLQLADSDFDYIAGGSLGDRTGENEDQKDLFDIMKEKGYTIAETKEDFDKINKDSEKVYAVSENLQDSGSMTYALDRKEGEQTLADMVAKGIEVMGDDENGFFMMAESGKIDWSEHANDSKTTIHEVIDFQDAIQKAVDFYNEHPEDTLIVVTADHATGGFTIGNGMTGYETYYNILEAQKDSQVAFDAKFEAAVEKKQELKFEDTFEMIKESFGLEIDKDNLQPMMSTKERYEASQSEDFNPYLVNEEEYKRLEEAFNLTLNTVEGAGGAAEAGYLYGGYNPISITCTRILGEKAGLTWTTTDHSGDKVPVYALGAGAQMFDGEFDNIDISLRINAAMGIPNND